MKFLLIAALIAVATASPARFIVPGPAGPTPVVDENESPISVGPVIIDENESPISIGPAIIDENESPISVGPVIIDESDYSPISIGPAIIDQIVDQPSAGSPLVQIIINVKPGAAAEVAEADEAESPAVIEPSPVIVVDNEEVIVEQPIINTPIFPSPVVVLPEALN